MQWFNVKILYFYKLQCLIASSIDTSTSTIHKKCGYIEPTKNNYSKQQLRAWNALSNMVHAINLPSTPGEITCHYMAKTPKRYCHTVLRYTTFPSLGCSKMRSYMWIFEMNHIYVYVSVCVVGPSVWLNVCEELN